MRAPRKILFASVPADGHFYPLTGMAMELKAQGHDVRWYTGASYAERLSRLGIPHLPFKRAREVTQRNLDEVFPERRSLRPGITQLKFDIKHIFVERAPEYLEDVREIHASFPFEALVSDVTFTAGELVKAVLGTKGIAVGVVPVMATSQDLPPSGLGLAPWPSLVGRLRDRTLRFVARRFLFRESTADYNRIIAAYGLRQHPDIIFDIATKTSDLFLQSGTTGFEYPRRDLPANLRFVGPLHAHSDPARARTSPPWMDRLRRYTRRVLVSQGTMEPDHGKLIIPAIDGLLDRDTLILVTTGRMNTEALRARYAQESVIIEDFIDFDAVMPEVDLFVTNGGYGSTLLAIDHGLPIVAAGVNEGKNEICARIGYFRLGVNLRTERPSAAAVRRAADAILADPSYRERVGRLRDEFRAQPAAAVAAQHILALLD